MGMNTQENKIADGGAAVTPLRVLLLEDSPVDAQIVLDELRSEHYDPNARVIDTPEAMHEALEESWDVIICDYVMPRFDGLAALKILQESGKNIPFIIISGKIGEDLAVDAIKKGANDYVMKHNLSRLGVAVSREMRALLEQQASDAVEVVLRTELGIRSRQLEVVARFNKMALSCRDPKELLEQAVHLVTKTLLINYCKILECVSGPDNHLLVQAVSGFEPALIGQKMYKHNEPHAYYSLEQKEPVIVTDFTCENRFQPAESHQRYGLVSGACTVIYGDQGAVGVLQADSTTKRYFNENDVFFLQSIANIVGTGLERIRSESALKESEERFRTLADIAPFLIAVSNNQGEIIYYNSTWCEYTGLSIQELLQHSWMSTIHPADFDTVKGRYDQALKAETAFEMEFRIRHISGEYRWVLAKGAPRKAKLGDFIGYVSLYIDIHQRKQFEQMVEGSNELLKNTISKLELSNKDLTHFATIASHDLQAPLRKAKAFSEMLKEDAGPKLAPEEMDSLCRIERSIQTMQDLVNDLLDLSQISKEPDYQAVDLSVLVRRVLADLQESIQEKKAEIEIGDLITIQGDEVQLQQLFQNLIENALKFQPNGQIPKLKIDSTLKSGGQVCVITFQDNGIGLEPEHSERIFETFERLHGKNDYPGTGVGLAICKRIVERHQGTITVSSSPGKGAAFTVSLPVYQSS
jgi:PAS domain S-box-containing protein